MTVHERKAKGSHVVINDDHGRVYTLPCHQGEKTMLSDVYLRRSAGVSIWSMKSSGSTCKRLITRAGRDGFFLPI